MPIFEYRCRGCGNDFELLVKSRDELVSCPECGGREVSKLFSAFALHASGSSPGAASSRSSCGGCSGKSCSSCR